MPNEQTKQDEYTPVCYSTNMHVDPADIATSSSGRQVVSFDGMADEWLKLLETQLEESFGVRSNKPIT